jgi:hypothetical protein
VKRIFFGIHERNNHEEVLSSVPVIAKINISGCCCLYIQNFCIGMKFD